MGWTSKEYNDCNHVNFNMDNAVKLINEEFVGNGYELKALSLKPAELVGYHNEIYVVMKNPSDDYFAMVVLVDIKNNEIYWKEISEDMFPFYHDMHFDMLQYLSETTHEMALKWRHTVKNKRIIGEYILFE